MKIILGSQSPRRKEILEYINLPFEQRASDFNERSVEYKNDPIVYVSTISQAKAQALMLCYPQDLIIAADTTVVYNNEIFHKPQGQDDAFKMLSKLQGNWHSVFTSITVQKGTTTYTEVEETKVLLCALSSEKIKLYHKSIHYMDKAAGYAIQGIGSLIVKRIEGCYYNVMGLPVQTLERLFNKHKMSLWNFIYSS